MKKVVITGATGMIGRALIKYLLEKDISILAIVREGSKKALDMPKHKSLRIVECSLNNLKKLEILENNYDTFFHFAWDGTFGNSRNEEEIQSNNIQYTIDALKLAKRLGCNTFIGAGSQAEYGRVEGIINENTGANPENFYGKAKLEAGKVSRKVASNEKIRHIWTRIFSVYGPYDNEKTMVMSSINKMLFEQESPEYTKGEQMWDYIYSEDVAKAFYLIGEKGKNNATYCIAQGEAHPLYTYIEQIRNKINKDITLKLGVIPYSEKQVMNLRVDISKLKEDTGFYPEYTFEKGIEKTIKWCKEGFENNEKN